MHRFETFGVGADGIAVTDVARWTWSIVPGTPVVVKDFAFSPATKYPKAGDTVSFSFAGPSDHSVRDASGIGLFDTGVQPAGTVLGIEVPSAGTFPFACAVHPVMKGSLKAGLQVTPSSGGPATSFIVRWALGPPPVGYAYDVQIQRPGSTTWKLLRNDGVEPSMSFVPDGGSGTYRFRARLQRLTAGASGYSGAATITVS